ncbi:leucine-rich repeat domain, L domain-like protein [Artemisia annua]|uniref:Leucine-rich repeat domain, L domain-like protein n=1 Tax=Artemisia annua TaxID=35608 RepID=A0A2U1Q1D1_ARTAN|nr:leucine-rich repeat domain, L domain-like protein [Artemisia annua]
MIEWHGNELEFTNNLRFLKSIDLSSNNLIGPIPSEITELHQLVALNLSKNTLQGQIPQTIDQMKEIQILDLSRNNFSGRLPSSMSQMNFLNYLDVSYNSLSGRIPYSTQLVSFGSSMYIGNAGLCGPPLPNNCRGDEELEQPPVIGESEGPGTDELLRWFYIGAGTGFATAFWIVCSTLFLNRRLRHAFFHVHDSLKDWVYVKVMLFIVAWVFKSPI